MNRLRFAPCRELRLACVLCALPFLIAATVRAELAITELMAAADLNFPDEDGEPSDWIEITNSGATPAPLTGHFLTNNAAQLTRWAFPDVVVPANSAVVIFASGKDRAIAGQPLHTSFTLDRGGDYLALVAPDGMTPVSEIAPGYPQQFEGISYGIGAAGGESVEPAVGSAAVARLFVPGDDSLGATWQQPGFDDSAWTTAVQPVGWESPGGTLETLIATDITADMRGLNPGGYFRFPFMFDGDGQQVVGAQLSVTIDDGYVAYLNGVEVASLHKRTPLLWNSTSNGSRSDTTVAAQPDVSDLSGFAGTIVDGENVLAIHAMNTTANGSDFLLAAELSLSVQDVSGGLRLGYLPEPTPGAPNTGVFDPPPAPVVFSATSQLFTSPMEVTLSCPTPGAVIRYTTDLSVPSNALGAESPEYTGPITVSSSTQIRAAAYLPGALDGPVRTESFLRMSQNVPSFSSDLPVVVVSTLGGGPPYESGSTLRRPAFLFFFEPDPVTGRTTLTQLPSDTTRGGIRKRGSSSAGWPKYAMSIEMWNDGDDLDNNLEPLGLPREADWILSARYEFDRALMRNPFIYSMSNQIGRYAVRTKFVEVYNDVNGGEVTDTDYFGVYSFMERIETDPARVDVERLETWHNSEPEVTGGYVWKKDRADPGEPGFSGGGMGGLVHVDPDGLQITPQQKSYISTHLAAVDIALSRADGTNPSTGIHYEDYVDAGSWIDHIWLNTLSMNVDWGRLSAYLHKDRGGKVVAGPIWDFDRTMGSEDSRSFNPRQWDGPPDSSRTFYDNRYPYFGKFLGFSSELNSTELQNPAAYTTKPDVFQRFIDRWAELRDGAFATGNIAATIDGMAAEIEEAQARNFARWSARPPNGGPFAEAGLSGWPAEVSHLKGWLTARVDWIDGQFLARPTFNHPGGLVDAGFGLVMTSAEGPIYYTLDGSDPRAPGGAPSATAIPFEGGPVDTAFLGEAGAFRYFVPSDDSLGTTWTEPGFDDSAWGTGTGGAGWESPGGTLEPLVATDLSPEMKGVNASGYFRYEFAFANADNVNAMHLLIHSDDGFVAYLNGVEITSNHKPSPLTFSSTSDGTDSDFTVADGIGYDVSAAADLLVDGTNVLAIHAMNSSLSGSDFLIRPHLTINHTVTSEALTLEGPTLVTARVRGADAWSAPAVVSFIAGAEAADSSNLVVSELHYRPPPPPPARRRPASPTGTTSNSSSSSTSAPPPCRCSAPGSTTGWSSPSTTRASNCSRPASGSWSCATSPPSRCATGRRRRRGSPASSSTAPASATTASRWSSPARAAPCATSPTMTKRRGRPRPTATDRASSSSPRPRTPTTTTRPTGAPAPPWAARPAAEKAIKASPPGPRRSAASQPILMAMPTGAARCSNTPKGRIPPSPRTAAVCSTWRLPIWRSTAATTT